MAFNRGAFHRQSTSADVLVERLQDYDGPPYAIILDESPIELDGEIVGGHEFGYCG